MGLVACVEEKPGISGTTSFRVEVVPPTELGTKEERLAETARKIQVKVTALDAQGAVDTSFSAQVGVYTHFLGSLTPKRSSSLPPLQVTVTEGEGNASLELPPTYGPAYLWLEDAAREGATLATGTSPVFWFRDPFLDDISRPEDERQASALERSPLEGKQVRVEQSKHGESGVLVVTAAFSNAYTVSDVRCSEDGCTADPYSHLYVFTFGRPRAQNNKPILEGQAVQWVSGGVGEFVGFTELNFPRTFLAEEGAIDRRRIPKPVEIKPAWLTKVTGTDSMINLEQLEGGLVAVSGGVGCGLDTDYDRFGQWKLDIGNGCGSPIHIVTRDTAPDIRPEDLKGKQVSRIVGILRNVITMRGPVWIVMPRRDADVTL
ncbi:MAG: hypothetical protein HY698_22670 [Deltaproteobacteria bacterium]|nr:hypothetical protein [Deltaproteobacteria bacterium]